MSGETKHTPESDIYRAADLPMSGYVDTLAYRSAQVAELIAVGNRIETENNALRASNAELREALHNISVQSWDDAADGDRAAKWMRQAARAALARTK